ncbi:MAG: GatB/YqeY domain-containing protein [Candidatus Magasanikbacteria bacterium]
MNKIQKQLKRDLKESMKKGKDSRVPTIRDMLDGLRAKSKETEGDLSEEKAQKVLKRKAKQRRDSIESFEEGEREDLAEKEKKELEIIEEYLPEQLDNNELENIIEKIIEEVGAVDMSDMGSVMGRAMEEVGVRAEGGRVKEMVKSKLSS